MDERRSLIEQALRVYGMPLPRGTQAAWAQELGVHRSTVTKDIRAIEADYREEHGRRPHWRWKSVGRPRKSGVEPDSSSERL